MRWVVDVVYLVAALAYLPVLVFQMLVQGKNRRGWGERLGLISLRAGGNTGGETHGFESVGFARGARGPIWIHGVSLGEVNATRRLVQKLIREYPDRQIVISSTTDTGYARACSLYGRENVFRFPLDFSWVVARVLKRIDPAVIVLMELEVWYNLIRMASGRGVKIAIANGRITERSAKRLNMLGPVSRSMFKLLDWVGAQDETTAKRFVGLGVPAERVQITGSMKWDTAGVDRLESRSHSETVEGADALASALGIDSTVPLWVCGSTGPGEEEILIRAYAGLLEQGIGVSLALVPRKPERFDEVAKLIRHRSFDCVRRTGHPDGVTRTGSRLGEHAPLRSRLGKGSRFGKGSRLGEHAPFRSRLGKGARLGKGSPSRRQIILGDTVGELRKFYALASVVFVGRSLVPMGGSDPMEAAALAKPVLCGPHMDNFVVAVEALRASEGLHVTHSVSELACAVREYVCDAQKARTSGEAARAVVVNHQGATDRTLEALRRLI